MQDVNGGIMRPTVREPLLATPGRLIFVPAVTRVTPVGNNGNFTKEAREIYSVVLKMQLVGYSC
jgi:hypothetical protein